MRLVLGVDPVVRVSNRSVQKQNAIVPTHTKGSPVGIHTNNVCQNIKHGHCSKLEIELDIPSMFDEVVREGQVGVVLVFPVIIPNESECSRLCRRPAGSLDGLDHVVHHCTESITNFLELVL